MIRLSTLLFTLLTTIAVYTAQADDWPMWGRTPERHMISPERNPPTDWDVEKGTNIKWTATLGSQSYANPVVAGGLVFMGTNNEAKRNPKFIEDAGVLMIFRESDGKFLWQRLSPKLKSGRVNDWPYQGICSTVCAEGDFIWFCTNRCEVVCLDVSPLRNGTGEPREVWVNDMMATLGVFPHNMTASSPTYFEDYLYVMTANGVDEAHKNVLSPSAPGLVCFNKKTGKVVWSDNSPGKNVLHGQWSSVTIATASGVTQVIAPMGDSWIRSFEARTGKLLWKCDANSKDTVYPTTRNELIATPIVEGNIMYLANGQDPEHGEGVGHLWAIDISRESNGGDVSKELANPAATIQPGQELMAEPAKIRSKGVPNPNSAVVWDFERLTSGPKVPSRQRMNRSISTVAVTDGLVFAPDFSGYLHCLDAKTGQHYWTLDTESALWGSPLICDGKLYLANEAGDVFILAVSKELKKLAQINMGSACYCSPVFANGVLYISTRDKLYAIEQKK
jgi:outer membrane protein assembly factor BamB